VPILPINIDELVILTQTRKQLLYSKIRDRYMFNVTKMQQTNNPNIAHEQWSIVAENFLRAWALDDKDDDLDTAVNALTYMDADLAQRPTKKYTRRGQMRRTQAEPAVKDVSKGTINARDYVGAALNKLASQCKALMLRLKRGSAPDVATQCPHSKIPLF